MGALWDIVSRSSLSDIRSVLLLIAAVLGAVVGGIKLASAVLDYRRLKKAEVLQRSLDQSATAFTKEEIRDALKSYIEPDCAQTDPSNQNDLRFVADVREPIMRAVERFVTQGGERRYILLLADSGMGKTTFCLNFYARQKKKGERCTIIPLGRPGAIPAIREIEAPSETILILDALDEDPSAIENSHRRIRELTEAAANFKSIIITCRSQFFLDDAAIPTETGIAVIRPRRGGERGSYKFFKLYLLPFSDLQIERYISSHYPIWDIGEVSRRRSARKIIAEIPELTVRPMLLALIPELIKTKRKVSELYDLYTFMVDEWLERESKWIDRETLLSVSKKIAVHMATSRATSNRDRVTVSTVRSIAEEAGALLENWTHLTSRSLLNRDSEGRFKFAHRSIMEFLFVAAAIDGDGRCFSVVWTDMMRDLLVSWGLTNDGRNNVTRAREIMSLDLERIGLSPLSTPLPSPRMIELGTLAKGGRPGDRAIRQRRIPIEWRKGALRKRKTDSMWFVRDYSYDLFWQISDHRALDDVDLRRLTYADTSRMEREGLRLPSIEEFVSLAEAERVLEVEMLEIDGYYWVGDQLGRGRNIVVRIGNEITPHERLRSIGKIEIESRSGQALWVYEVSPLGKGRTSHHAFKAMVALVRDGDAEGSKYPRGRLEAALG